MPLSVIGEIEYTDMFQGALRYQVSPPVCNRCQQAITRANFGWMYWEGDARGQFEFIECRGCTMMRASGTPLREFIKRHRL
jgi:hypothetical protein